MPLSSRYTTGAFKTTSSLFKSAQSTAKKLESINDAEQKFLWDTNQISNEEYYDYAQKRMSKSTDPLEQISWERTIQSVEREYRKDFRNQAALEISQIPGNTSQAAQQKLQTYFILWQDALKTGDEDQAIQYETQFNNQKEVLSNKLESEAKAGDSRAKKYFAQIRSIEQEIINRRELLLKDNISADVYFDEVTGQIVAQNQREVVDPGEKLLLQLDIKADKSDLLAKKLSDTESLDPDNIDKIESIKNDIYANEQLLSDMHDKVSWTKDEQGNEIPQMNTDAAGVSRVKLADGLIARMNGSDMTIYDARKNLTYKYATDQNTGRMNLVEAPNVESDRYVTDPDTQVQYKINDINPDGSGKNKSDQEILKELKAGKKDVGSFDYKMPDGRIVKGLTNRDMKNGMNSVNSQWLSNPDGTRRLNPLYNPLDAERGFSVNPTLSSADQELLYQDTIRKAQMDFATRAGYKGTYEELMAKKMLPTYDNTSGQWKLPVINIGGKEVINTPGPIKLPANEAYTPTGSINKGYGLNAAPMTNEPTKTFNETFFGPNFDNPLGKESLGYASGIEYWKQKRADGGYDVYKGNNFKLSKADAEKELGKSLGNW